MSIIEAIGNIGIAVFIEAQDITAFNEAMVAKFTEEELANMSANPEDYDPEYPTDVISDREEAEVEEFYRQHLNKEYPLLEIYSYGSRYGKVDGYAVFVLSTHSFIEMGKLDIIEPTREGFDQLRKFQKEFVPHQEIGRHQWVHVC